MTPLKRLYNLYSLDRRDIYQILFYAAFAGLISLSLPLGIQAIVNFIQSGRVSVSWIVLVFIVTAGVVLGGILSLMQLRITENLQQKIFIRSSFEFAARLPRILFGERYPEYPPEVANRFFDTLTIQKGTAKMLLDFSAALLQIVFGVILLSLYHPFFIIFGLMLMILLFIIFKFSFKSGVKTSLKESKYKYAVAGWLQEIARNYMSFKKTESFRFALAKNDRLTHEYLTHREKHFAILRRQFAQLIGFKALITVTLLAVGGYLVIAGQINIGQFVAAEIIILLVIGSVEKIILGLETFYDVLTSVEKIGEVTDMEIEPDFSNQPTSCFRQIQLHTKNVSVVYPDATQPTLTNINLEINQGERIVVEGPNGSGKTTLIRVLAGLITPTKGNFYTNDAQFDKIDKTLFRNHIAGVIHGETPFAGTIAQNLNFDETIDPAELGAVLRAIGLDGSISELPQGMQTQISPEGRLMSSSDAQKLLVARAILRKPLVLFFEDPTDKMDDDTARQVIDYLMDPAHRWTVIVTSKNPYWKSLATRLITVNNGTITQDKPLKSC